MNNMLEYRGYLGSILYSEEDETFHGRLEFIRDLVTYEGRNAKSLKRAFCDAVDDYLRLCEEQGRKPDVPLKGSFNVRPGTGTPSSRHALRVPEGDDAECCGDGCTASYAGRASVMKGGLGRDA